jgi:hypothetical protein
MCHDYEFLNVWQSTEENIYSLSLTHSLARVCGCARILTQRAERYKGFWVRWKKKKKVVVVAAEKNFSTHERIREKNIFLNAHLSYFANFSLTLLLTHDVCDDEKKLSDKK